MKEIKGNQSGRSMVEMLGVLAIIGVLSITAVGGYRWAMDKMAANDIVNEIKKRAVVASQQRILGNTLDLTEFREKIRDTYAVAGTDSYNGNTSAFTISVSDIDKGVCDKLIKMDWVLPVVKKLNDTEMSDASTCAETNTVLYVFNNDLTVGVLNNGNSGGGTDSDSGDETPTCGPNEYVDINTNKCVEDTKCSVGEFFHSGNQTCSLCPTNVGEKIEMSSELEDNCSKCSNTVAIAGADTNYICINCPSPRVACGSTCCAEGDVCQVSGSWGGEFTCISPQCRSNADCSTETPLCDMLKGVCFSGCRENKDCKAGEFCDLDVNSTSHSCTQKPGQGICQPTSITTVGSYTRSTTQINWWSAENFCKAIRKKMADPMRECTPEELAAIKNTQGGPCQALAGLENDYNSYWTKRLVNSCTAWHVCFADGWVSNVYGRKEEYYALCE